MAAKPKNLGETREVWSEKEIFERQRKVNMREGWCMKVGGDRGQRGNNKTGKGQEEKNLCESVQKTGPKKA